MSLTSDPGRSSRACSPARCPEGAKLPKRSWVKVSQIRTLSVKRLGKKLGSVSADELEQLIDGLNEIVGA